MNDLIFATNGDLYFTDQGRTGLQSPTGRVWRYTEVGVLECLIDNVPSPNGLVFNLRETALYVAVTRANAVWRIELDDPARRTGLFVQLSAAGPDGLALDASGNVVVAHPTVGAVWMFNRIGTPVYYLKSCAKEMTTNIAYGGDDNRTLFVTRVAELLDFVGAVAGAGECDVFAPMSCRHCEERWRRSNLVPVWRTADRATLDRDCSSSLCSLR